MEYPKTLLKKIYWNFEKEKFSSIEKFKKSLIAYNEGISGEPFDIDLEEKILKCSKIVVQYTHWDEEEEDIVEPDFLLQAYNGANFTSTELLYRVHNMVCYKLQDEDDKFFEGFDIWEGENPNHPDVPLYFLGQGS